MKLGYGRDLWNRTPRLHVRRWSRCRLFLSLQGCYHICGNVNSVLKANPPLRSSMVPTSFGHLRPLFSLDCLNVILTYLEPLPTCQENLRTATDHNGSASSCQIKSLNHCTAPKENTASKQYRIGNAFSPRIYGFALPPTILYEHLLEPGGELQPDLCLVV